MSLLSISLNLLSNAMHMDCMLTLRFHDGDSDLGPRDGRCSLLTIFALAATVLVGQAAVFCMEKDGMAGISGADMPGIWMIESASYPVQPMPKNLVRFALALNNNGTFSALNVPAGLLFGPLSQVSGTWHLKPSKGVPELTLDFTSPSNHFWSGPMIWLEDSSSGSRKLALQTTMGTGAYAFVCLTKSTSQENGVKSAGSEPGGQGSRSSHE